MDDQDMTAKFEHQSLAFFGSKEYADAFWRLGNSVARLEAIWAVPVMQDMLKKSGTAVNQKSIGESKRYRDIGNKHYQAGRWREALTAFSTAASFAPQNGEGLGKDLSLAFANRSASLFQMGEFSSCLEDIDLALSSGYPKELRYKVLERRIRCMIPLGALNSNNSQATSQESSQESGTRGQPASMALIPTSEDVSALEDALEFSSLGLEKRSSVLADIRSLLASTTFRDSEKMAKGGKSWFDLPDFKARRPDLPTFSNAVEIKFSPSLGRYGVANRRIETGEVISIEAPVTASLYPSLHADHCDLCMHYIPLRQVPCRGCSLMRFCSEACRKEASETYHKYECGREDVYDSIMGRIMQEGQRNAEGVKKVHRLALKTVTQKTINWFLEHKDEVKMRELDRKGEGSSYSGLATLVSHIESMPRMHAFCYLVSAAFHLRNLQQMGYFGTVKNKVTEQLTENEKFIGELLFRYLTIFRYNCHAVIQGVPDADHDFLNGKLRPDKLYENKIRCIGHAIYPGLALLNHSCYSNINKYFVGTTMVAVACRTIYPGEEISENYYPVVHVMPRADRRAWLSEFYSFDCGCPACLTNMADIASMPWKPAVFRCQQKDCVGLIESATCKLCSSSIDRSKLEEEAEEIRLRLEILRQTTHSRTPLDQLKVLYDQILAEYKRLQDIVAMPCRLLYSAEIQFWRALRLVHGNRFY